MASRRDLLRALIRDDTMIDAEVHRRLAAYADDLVWAVSVQRGIVEISDPGEDRQRIAAATGESGRGGRLGSGCSASTARSRALTGNSASPYT